MNLKDKKLNRREAGFTLVELMVGLTIGMLATVVIMQVLSVFEAQKRSTTGTADAQTNGGIALYTITRDLQMAGWGMHPVGDPLATTASATAFSPLSCGTLTVDGAAGIDPGVHCQMGAGRGDGDRRTRQEQRRGSGQAHRLQCFLYIDECDCGE